MRTRRGDRGRARDRHLLLGVPGFRHSYARVHRSRVCHCEESAARKSDVRRTAAERVPRQADRRPQHPAPPPASLFADRSECVDSLGGRTNALAGRVAEVARLCRLCAGPLGRLHPGALRPRPNENTSVITAFGLVGASRPPCAFSKKGSNGAAQSFRTFQERTRLAAHSRHEAGSKCLGTRRPERHLHRSAASRVPLPCAAGPP